MQKKPESLRLNRKVYGDSGKFTAKRHFGGKFTAQPENVTNHRRFERKYLSRQLTCQKLLSTYATDFSLWKGRAVSEHAQEPRAILYNISLSLHATCFSEWFLTLSKIFQQQSLVIAEQQIITNLHFRNQPNLLKPACCRKLQEKFCGMQAF